MDRREQAVSDRHDQQGQDGAAEQTANHHSAEFGGDQRTFGEPDGEALRRDDEFCHVSVWEYKGDDNPPVRHKEPLVFEYVKPTQRSYK